MEYLTGHIWPQTIASGLFSFSIGLELKWQELKNDGQARTRVLSRLRDVMFVR